MSSRFSFNDFETFSDAVKGYDLDIRQLSRGSFSAEMQHVSHGAVVINRFLTSLRVEAYGGPPPGALTFGVPTGHCDPFVWRHMSTLANSIQVYHSDTELALVTNPLFEAIDVSISQDEFARLCQVWEFPEPERLIGNREMVICRSAEMEDLRASLKYVCDTLELGPERLLQDAELRNLVSFQVPYMIASALISSELAPVNPSAARREYALRNAIEYIQETANEAVTIETVCNEIGVGMRTLQRAFRDRYDLSPKFYLQSQKLNSIYKILLRAHPQTTRVTDVAMDQGYWHLGQFASDYRRFFGELPSDTLQRPGWQ